MALDMGHHLPPGAMISEGGPITLDLEPLALGAHFFILSPCLLDGAPLALDLGPQWKNFHWGLTSGKISSTLYENNISVDYFQNFQNFQDLENSRKQFDRNVHFQHSVESQLFLFCKSFA